MFFKPQGMAFYLLTGVAGFIASKVAEFLLGEGHTVIGVDNMNDAYDVRLKKWRLEKLMGRPNFTFYPIDISDLSSLRGIFSAQFDAIINLAARAGVRQSVENPWVYYEANVTGTLNLLELAKEHGTKRFILASTSSLYGKHNPMPYREDADTSIPLSPYAASKKAAETLCYTYHYLYGIDVTVLRYFTVYGPAGRPDMSLFRFVQWIMEGKPVLVYGDGTQSRDFTYVDDIARGTIAAVKYMEERTSPSPVYEIINLGSDTPVVLMDAIRLVEELTSKRANIEFLPMHPADVHATWADIGKAKELLGWSPSTPFEEGMRNLVNWYRKNREWAREVETDEGSGGKEG